MESGAEILKAWFKGDILSRNSRILGSVSSPYSKRRAARRCAAVFWRKEGQWAMPKLATPHASFEEKCVKLAWKSADEWLVKSESKKDGLHKPCIPHLKHNISLGILMETKATYTILPSRRCEQSPIRSSYSDRYDPRGHQCLWTRIQLIHFS